jgi:hypothetical protein
MAEVFAEGAASTLGDQLERLHRGPRAGSDNSRCGLLGRGFSAKLGGTALRLFVLAQLHDYGHVLVPRLAGPGNEQRQLRRRIHRANYAEVRICEGPRIKFERRGAGPARDAPGVGGGIHRCVHD